MTLEQQKNKLDASIYAAFFLKNDQIRFYGLTFTYIRSDKHGKSCTAAYSDDFEKILHLEEFLDEDLFASKYVIERQISPLSRDTVDIISSFNTFENHLEASYKTIDLNLEIKDFKASGKILAKI